MIKEANAKSLIQELDGQTKEIPYSDLEIKNGFIHLPVVNNKLEVLSLNDSEDDYSRMVAKVFAKVAALK